MKREIERGRENERNGEKEKTEDRFKICFFILVNSESDRDKEREGEYRER